MDHIKLALECVERSSGASHVVGIDEVGRGPIAGPVTVAAVEIISPNQAFLDALDDSKKLTPRSRERLVPHIRQMCVYGIGQQSHKVIDSVGIEDALAMAARDAFMAWMANTAIKGPIVVLLDGDTDFLTPVLGRTLVKVIPIVKGDGSEACIMAASVLAKETRDALMADYDREFPGYNFSQHAGYGTPKHIAALRDLGPSPIHRKWWKKAAKIKEPV